MNKSDIQDKLNIQLDLNYKSTKDLILIFAYYTQMLSAKELAYMCDLTETYSYGTIRRTILRLVKDGLLCSHKLRKSDCGTYNIYYLTLEGYNYASCLIEHIEPYRSFKDRHPNTVLHDYSTGMNFIQFFLSDLPFHFYHETTFAANMNNIDGSKIYAGISTDALAIIPEKGANHIYYIEQDMGTESIWQLIDKIKRYIRNNLLSDERSEIIFSFRSPYINIEHSKCLTVNKVRDLLTQISSYLSETEDIDNTGAAGRGAVLIKDFSFSGAAVKDTAAEFISCVPGGGDFSVSDLTNYLDDLSKNVSDRNIDYGLLQYNLSRKKQVHFARRRYFSILKNLSSSLLSAKSINSVINYFLNGGSCYVSATCDLNKLLYRIYNVSSPLILDEYANTLNLYNDHRRNWLAMLQYDILPSYFPDFDTSGYTPSMTFTACRSCNMDQLEDHSITFKRCFTYYFNDEPCYVSIELLSDDIGSYVRTHYAYWHIDFSTPVIIVLTVTDIADAYKFCELANYYLPYGRIFFGRFSICFHLIGSDDLFVIGIDKEIKPCTN